MTKKAKAAVAALLRRLAAHPEVHLAPDRDGSYALVHPGQPGPGKSVGPRYPSALVRALASIGLLEASGHGGLSASADAAAWLARQDKTEIPFRAQHGALEQATLGESSVMMNRDESPVAALAHRTGKTGASPVAALAHRTGKTGAPWLDARAVAAAERLRRDFELGGLQPRITANWSASVSSGRRSGGAGLTDLTDMAMAARRRVDGAVNGVGPELSGVLIDVCCFLKGLETVERERQWPARSAKLVLRLALDGLARHYGLGETAQGPAGARHIRHWGEADYRPSIDPALSA